MNNLIEIKGSKNRRQICKVKKAYDNNERIISLSLISYLFLYCELTDIESAGCGSISCLAARLANFLAFFCSPIINKQGVRIKVKTVAKVKPPAIDVDS